MLLVAIILFVLIIAGLTALTFENFQNVVTLSLFGWHTPSLPVGLLLMFAFCLGALVLYGLAAASAWQDTRELRRLRLQVAQLERSVAAVPASPPASLEAQGPANAAVVPMPGMSQPPPPDISDMTTLH